MPGPSGGLSQQSSGILVQAVAGSPENILNPSATFIRPNNATPYTSGDLVANSATAGSVVPMTLQVGPNLGSAVILRRAILRKTGVSTTNAQFRAHVYNTSGSIVCANGDNGAWSTNGVSSYVGSFDITIDRAFTDGASGAGVPTNGIEMSLKLDFSTKNVQVLLEARAAYTPEANEVFTLSFEDLV